MKISIIIPIYNVESFIKDCILSALNQSYQNIEVILIDDCGTDDSLNIAENTIKSHTRHKLTTVIRHERNRGISATRNTGIIAATGEYIFFLDSDDKISHDCIEVMVQKAMQWNPDFVISDYEMTGSDITDSLLKLDSGLLCSNSRILETFLKRDWYMMPWNKLINRRFLTSNNLYFKEGVVHEDELWSFILACKAKTAYIIKTKTYTYNIRPGSITQSPSLKSYESTIAVIGFIVDFVREDETLRKNREVYNYIEGLKSMFFLNIVASDFKNDLMYSSYKKIRKSKYIYALLSFSRFKLNFQRAIRNLHYLLPTYLGFLYYKNLLFYKSRIDYNNGKFS